ncbi:Signal-peptide peptidase, presenilin aspartyl protease [uncultured archaeon]|nr:Signal-peptide peptidase, presenilin aspartyl protease [uncultured archaeon]
MFIITQLIGLFVISVYSHPGNSLPYGVEPPPEVQAQSSLISILISFVIAIGLFLLLIRLNAETFIRFWFFAVTSLALAIAINAFLFKTNLFYPSIISLVIAVTLAYFKIFKRNIQIHNLTELFIYPGIAAVLVPILNIFGIILFLLLISLYDIWAVWHTQFMQKMANYQINNLRFFTGFFIPYADKRQKQKINLIKEKYIDKSDEFLEKKFKKAKIKVSLAILGGGDVVFPIIATGVFYKTYLSIIPSLIISLFATLALLSLFLFARKGKFYPAMPFLTIGIYLGMMIDWMLIGFHII